MKNPYIFKPLEINKPLKFGKKNNELIKILAKKLEIVEFKPIDPSSSKQQLNFLSGYETGFSYTKEQIDNSKEEEYQINIIKYQNTYKKKEQKTSILYPLLHISNTKKVFL